MRIGILTGGGDVPGLNPCIKAVVNRAEDAGLEIVGIRHYSKATADAWWRCRTGNTPPCQSIPAHRASSASMCASYMTSRNTVRRFGTCWANRCSCTSPEQRTRNKEQRKGSRHVVLCSLFAGGEAAYTRQEAMGLFQEAASAAGKPFIYLSAGVTDEVFRETLELAAEAETPFAGVLCGRATWQDAIPIYAREGVGALEGWLEDRGVQNIEALNTILRRSAKPWWTVYGGREQIEVINPR